MFESEYWQQICSKLDRMPSSRDNFFREVWEKGRLRFEGGENLIDEVDRHSAQLICAVQSQQKSLLIVLPDEAPHRIPLAFATALLKQAFDNISLDIQSRPAVYFGAAAGIRNYLSQTYCGNYCLKELFTQTDLKRNIDTNLPALEFQNRLPHVIFSNMPTNPDQIINIYQPDWCFVDLGNSERLKWFSSCLAVLRQADIPVIACIHNPLSSAIQQCEEAGWQIFRWPYPTYSQTDHEITTIQPVVLEGKTVEWYAEQYLQVYLSLSDLSKKIKGKFTSDALWVIRQYAQSLEQLNTPYDFYEIESSQFWGIYSLSDSQKTAQRFVESFQIEQPAFGQPLYDACKRLDGLHQRLQSGEEPPLWETLCNLCVSKLEKDYVRLLVFPSEALKTLFARALLAYYDFSTDDLASINVWLVGLKQFSQWQRAREHHNQGGACGDDIPPVLVEKLWCPLLVGVPHHTARYASLLRCEKLDVLLYPHQIRLLSFCIDKCNQSLHTEPPDNLRTLSTLTGSRQPIPAAKNSTCPSQRVVVATPHQWKVEVSKKEVSSKAQVLFRTPKRVDEIAWLMETDDDFVEESVLLDEPTNEMSSEGISKETISVEKVIQVTFCEGFQVLFPLHATIQVVLHMNQKRKLDERSIRSLHVGDTILFIHGQQRQNLYELIISRIHAHPSFAFYLNLIQRWQEEVVQHAKISKLTPEEILSRMTKRGSQLKTPQTIRHWLDGRVMCPIDSKDLERIANILDMSFVKQYQSQIVRAASRLRGIHRGLSRKLNGWLQQGAVEATPEQINEFIDPELGITFNDFQDALRLLTVKEIKQVEGLFLTSDLGQLSEGINYA